MNDIRKGRVIVLDGEPFVVVSAEFSRKQQRRPVVRSTIRHVQTGRTREHTFMQSDKVEEADIERVSWQFLYRTDDQYIFMNTVSFEQVELGDDVVGQAGPLLLEGQEVEVKLFNGAPVSIELPIKIDRMVLSAPPGVKGDTSTNVMKDVEIEGGATVKAPLFVKAGDKIRIDTRTGEYVERA